MVLDPFKLHSARALNSALRCDQIPAVDWTVFAKSGDKAKLKTEEKTSTSTEHNVL